MDLWFLDLASQRVRQFTGRGSGGLTALAAGEVQASASYAAGEWSAVFVRNLRSSDGLSFAESQYVPMAFSVWDGTARERGNRRGLTQWFYVYLPPREKPGIAGPMAAGRAGRPRPRAAGRRGPLAPARGEPHLGTGLPWLGARLRHERER